MAISRLSKTMMLMTENEPNISRPENRVNSLMPVSSKLSKSIRPKIAQKRVWDVSHKLKNVWKSRTQILTFAVLFWSLPFKSTTVFELSSQFTYLDVLDRKQFDWISGYFMISVQNKRVWSVNISFQRRKAITSHVLFWTTKPEKAGLFINKYNEKIK